MPKKVAAIVTEYRRHSHADVLVGKILDGFLYDGKEKPDLELVTLYVDQTPAGDWSVDLAKKHGFTLCKTIAETLTRDGKSLAVEGVLCVGEHGHYPTNERGQILYPRRHFFESVCKVFTQVGKSVPVFNDKHLAASWEDAKWMYDRAHELHVPFLAGSSLPVTWRRPELKLERGAKLTGAVQIGYGPLEGYGFHALEAMQCLVERRAGGEVGVAAVTCLQGEAMWQALDKGRWSKPLLETAMALVPAHAKADVRATTTKAKDAAVWLIEYRDGFQAALAMLNGWVYEGDGGAFVFAGQVKDQEKPAACHFYLQQPDPFAHFGYLLRAIEKMIHTSHPPYPVERTLLTKADGGKRVPTPHLAIKYEPTDYPFATGPVPKGFQRGARP